MGSPVGRPTKYQEDMPQRAYDVLAAGKSLAKVAATLDISLETLNVWRKDADKSAFSEAIKKGLAVAESVWDDEDFRTDMNPLRYKLNMAQRFGWREKTATEITGKDGEPVSIEHKFGQVSPTQAQAIAREFLIGVAPTQDDEQGREDGDDESAGKVSTISRVLRSIDAASSE